MLTTRDEEVAENGDERTVEIDGRVLTLTRSDKPLWPRAHFTKADLVAYYRSVADVLLPHVRGRGMTLVRFPDGVEAPGWYQSNCRGNPAWIPIVRVESRKATPLRYCLLNEPAALVWAANVATLELHPFLHAADRPEHPRAVVFDLDPGTPATLLDCCRIALRLRERITADGLHAWVKVSGQLGLHVVVPLGADSPHTYAETKAWARAVARELTQAAPDEVVDRSLKSLRQGRVFIDWSQNSAGKSTVAPYSLRAAAYPFVSMPVAWEELSGAIRSQDPGTLVFGPADVPSRLQQHGDLFAPVARIEQRLSVPEL